MGGDSLESNLVTILTDPVMSIDPYCKIQVKHPSAELLLATLPPNTAASIAIIKAQCLSIVNLATKTEWQLFTKFGEVEETLVVLTELKTVAQEASDAFSRFNSLQLKVATAQPEISSALAKLIMDSKERIEARIPAWERSIEEILLTWRLP